MECVRQNRHRVRAGFAHDVGVARSLNLEHLALLTGGLVYFYNTTLTLNRGSIRLYPVGQMEESVVE